VSAPLFRKTFNDSRWLLVACAGVLFAFSWIRVIIVASIELHQFQRLARNLPELIQRLSPVPLDRLINYPGLLSFTYEEPLAYLIMAVWSVSRGSDCVSGEIGRGTMEMLLAQPISRLRYLTMHTLVSLLGIVLLSLAAHAGTTVGVQATQIKQPPARRQFTVPFIGLKLDAAAGEKQPKYVPISQYVKRVPFWIAAVNYACLGVFLLGLSTAMSAWDRYRWRTIGIVVGFYVVQSVIELVGMAIQRCRWMLHLTFFAAYEPVAFVTQSAKQPETPWLFWASQSAGSLPDLGPMGCNTVLLVLGAAGLLAANLIFHRRDIPAPL
jgi:ABC-2 type transport system permease protein